MLLAEELRTADDVPAVREELRTEELWLEAADERVLDET